MLEKTCAQRGTLLFLGGDGGCVIYCHYGSVDFNTRYNLKYKYRFLYIRVKKLEKPAPRKTLYLQLLLPPFFPLCIRPPPTDHMTMNLYQPFRYISTVFGTLREKNPEKAFCIFYSYFGWS
jgi:hypothetical protein